MISYVISLMKACLPVRAFAWKEVSTETLPDSCPDPPAFPLVFAPFSCAFAIARPASLPPNRAALVSSGPQAWNRNAAHASTRAARAACLAATTRALPSALPMAPACTQPTPSTSIGAKPRNFAFCDTPLSTPPIQEKTNPQVGLFFIACKWALRV